MRGDMHPLASAALAWVQARKEARQHREARRKSREEFGQCDAIYPGSMMPPCYLDGVADLEGWCDACREAQPHHVAYRAASTRQGVALRRMLRLAAFVEAREQA